MTSAELQELPPRANLFVARLEFHAFVSTFAHCDRNAFVILVECLSFWAPAALNTLQSAEIGIIQITTQTTTKTL